MLEKIQEKWDEILQVIKIEYDLTDISVKIWLNPLKIHSVDHDIIYITGSDARALEIVEKKYYNPLRVVINEIMNHEFDIKFISQEEIESLGSNKASTVINDDSKIIDAGLNPKYTFESFVVGQNNTLAFNASLAVADAPGEIYNPLFIYGGVGLGKTHLMQSIGNYIIRSNPSLKVMYVTSETFTNELIDIIRTKKDTSYKEFRDKYRYVDVLLIDDIQFIIGKPQTQEEFFHTFNTLRESKKQIIISSDRPPKHFEELEDRLRSRFEQGLMVDISPPAYETRMAILRKKAEIENYKIDETVLNEVLDYIATNVKSNIRELEGSLTRLVAYSKLTHQEITLAFAEDVLNDIISSSAHRDITPDLIIKIVAEHYGCSSEDITSVKRNQKIVVPRHIAIYLCHELTDLPLENIGNYVGKRDHSTVSYAIEKITNQIKTDASLASTVDIIKKKINPSI